MIITTNVFQNPTYSISYHPNCLLGRAAMDSSSWCSDAPAMIF